MRKTKEASASQPKELQCRYCVFTKELCKALITLGSMGARKHTHNAEQWLDPWGDRYGCGIPTMLTHEFVVLNF